MKKTRKIISWTLVLSIFVFIGIVLASNKQNMEEQAGYAKLKAEFIPVEVQKVNVSMIEKSMSSNGILQPDKKLMLLSETQGRILRIFKQNGDKVRKGDVIAKVDDELLQANFKLAKANYQKQQKDLQRMKKLSQENAITQQQLEQIELAVEKASADLTTIKRRIADTEIKAPISGIINTSYIEEGMLVAAGRQICELVDISTFKLNIELNEYDVVRVSEGQLLEVSPGVDAALKMTGKVKAIAQSANQSMKYPVEIQVQPDDENRVKGGMYVNCQFLDQATSRGILINRKAVVGSAKQSGVFVAMGDSAKFCPVVLGEEVGDQVEILQGLNPGDNLIVSGQLNLVDGSRIQLK